MRPRELRHAPRPENPELLYAGACPIAFHLRSLRQWHGERGLTQTELARAAGVSRHFVVHLENACELQASVEAILRVAYVLGLAVEELVAPKRLAEIKAEIAPRLLELEARQNVWRGRRHV